MRKAKSEANSPLRYLEEKMWNDGMKKYTDIFSSTLKTISSPFIEYNKYFQNYLVSLVSNNVMLRTYQNNMKRNLQISIMVHGNSLVFAFNNLQCIRFSRIFCSQFLHCCSYHAIETWKDILAWSINGFYFVLFPIITKHALTIWSCLDAILRKDIFYWKNKDIIDE